MNISARYRFIIFSMVLACACSSTACGKKDPGTPGYDMLYSDASPARFGGFIGEGQTRVHQSDYYISDALKWTLHPADSRASIISEVKTTTRTGFYYRGHGAGAGGTIYVSDEGPEEGDGTFAGMYINGATLTGGDLTPAFCTHTFAFVNACWSGLLPGSTQIQAALTAGGPKLTTYLGWGNRINEVGAGLFALYFF